MPGPCYWDFLEANPYIFCEKQLCRFITEPANTWTNIGYLIAAVLILRSTDVTNKRVKHFFFASTFTLFLGSTFFHATSTYLGKFIDVAAMFFLSMTILTLSVERYYKIKEWQANIFFAVGLLFSIGFLYIMKFGNILFASQLLFATILEWKLHQLQMKKVSKAVMILGVAFVFWIMDVKGIMCHPGNHVLTGHGLWHLSASLSIFTYFKAYVKSNT